MITKGKEKKRLARVSHSISLNTKVPKENDIKILSVINLEPKAWYPLWLTTRYEYWLQEVSLKPSKESATCLILFAISTIDFFDDGNS